MNLRSVTPKTYLHLVKKFREITKSEKEEDDEKLILSKINNENKSIFDFPFKIAYIIDPHKNIKSYGCIMRTVTDGKPNYLCVKRRDTVDYSAFIIGAYDMSYLPLIISGISQEERTRILSFDFDELWKDHMGLYDYEKDIYEHAKNSFELMKPYLEELFYVIPINDIAEKNMWIFPKGKRNREENGTLEDQFECAKREFSEETHGVSTENCDIFCKTYEEKFTATNGKCYSTSYYVLNTDNADIKPVKGPHTPVRKEPMGETKFVEWMNIEEIKKNFIETRVEIIEQIEKDIQEKENVIRKNEND